MKTDVLLDELIVGAKQELTNQKYAPNVMWEILVTFRQLADFAKENGIVHYSVQLVDDFMAQKYDHPPKDAQAPVYKQETIRRKISHLKKLEWMCQLSRMEKGRTKIRKPFSKEWAEVFGGFDSWLNKRNFAQTSKSRYALTLSLFAEYMMKLGIESVAEVTPFHISDYTLTMRGNAPTSIQGDLGRIRRFLKFAYLEGYTTTNLEDAVPKFGSSVATTEANIWSKDELDKLLGVIDRGNATGKRDYAIILMAIDLGMRMSDIISLTLENIDWERGSVEFNQQKTKSALTLPLSERVGLAIIDYLKHARPKTVCPNVFVSHLPPYDGIGGFSNKFSWYVGKAGITKKPNRRYGMHSLRNTVATRMLESGVSFDVIVPFIGHADENTLNRYLGMDIENLRKCALSFDFELEGVCGGT